MVFDPHAIFLYIVPHACFFCLFCHCYTGTSIILMVASILPLVPRMQMCEGRQDGGICGVSVAGVGERCSN